MKNNINLKYFLILLKKHISFMLFNVIIFSLVYLLPLLIEYSDPIYHNEKYYNISTNYGGLITALAIYAFVMPIASFGYLTRKKQIDTYYSLPITRNNIAIIHTLTVIISILIPFTLVYFTGSIITMFYFNEIIYFYYLLFYIIVVILFFLYFIFNCFFFTRANKISDGIITVFLGNLVFITIAWTIVSTLDLSSSSNNVIVYSFAPFSGFIAYGNYFNNLIMAKYNYYDYCTRNISLGYVPKSYNKWFEFTFPFSSFCWLYLIVLFVFAFVCFILFFVLNKKRKPEDAEEVSNSKFGLQVLTPTFFTCLSLVLAVNTNILSGFILYCIIIIGYLSFTVVEIRSFKLPLYKILILIGITSLMFIF